MRKEFIAAAILSVGTLIYVFAFPSEQGALAPAQQANNATPPPDVTSPTPMTPAQEPDAVKEEYYEEEASEEGLTPEEIIDMVANGNFEDLPATAAGAPSGDDLDSYLVTLDATKEVKKPGRPGELRVWIGAEEYAPRQPTGAARDEAYIEASNQNSARVHPFSTGFAFSPGKSDCLLLDAGGTVSRFEMAPLDTGEFDISADVYLFPTEDCTGTPKPRNATTLSVSVSVDTAKLITSHLAELWTIFWEKALEFWGWLVGFMFLVATTYIRSRVKKKMAEKGVSLPDEDPPST